MVVGNGMVAKRFERYKEIDSFAIFASGVSNSKQSEPTLFEKEFQLLKETIKLNPKKIFVYFSTCSINDPDELNSPYVKHKQAIETYIQQNHSQYYIFRVSNLVGHSHNPNTILNYFVNHIRSATNFDLWENASRNLIDIDDMYAVVDYILTNRIMMNQVIMVANPLSYPVTRIIEEIENVFELNANYIRINKGRHFEIDVSSIKPLFRELNIDFSEGYLGHLLQKYYSHE